MRRAEIVLRYKRGATIGQIAREFRMSDRAVRRVIMLAASAPDAPEMDAPVPESSPANCAGGAA